MKNFKLPILLLALYLSAQVSCLNITYSVIFNAFQNDNLGVIIDNITTPFLLNPSPETPYLFTGSAPTASKGYKYTIIRNNNEVYEFETFLRSPVTSNTLNEFYGRSENMYSVTPILQSYPPLSSIHRINSSIHQENEIPTFFFYGNKEGIKCIHSNITSKIKIRLNLTYIGLNQVKTINEIKFRISGRGTRHSPKSSYKINLGKGNDLFGFQKIKLRSLTTDPSYLREKISNDLIQSFGLGAPGLSFARIFIDDKPYGLFGVQEDIDDLWLTNVFNNGEKNHSLGVLYNGNLGASLNYLGNNESLYTVVDNLLNESIYKINELPSKNGKKITTGFNQLIEFTKFLTTAPTTTQENAVAIWKEKIDTDSVLRSLALEIIIGNVDGYIVGLSNYFLYSDPNQNGRFTFIPNDMDMTFGSTSKVNCTSTLYQENYKELTHFNTTLPLLDKILQVPEFKWTFDELIAKAVYNLNNIYSHIDTLSMMIKEDVNWDKSITRDYVSLPDIEESKENITLILKDQDKILPFILDYMERTLQNNIAFEEAINGTIPRPTLMGLKQWISKAANSYLKNY